MAAEMIQRRKRDLNRARRACDQEFRNALDLLEEEGATHFDAAQMVALCRILESQRQLVKGLTTALQTLIQQNADAEDYRKRTLRGLNEVYKLLREKR